VKIEFYTKPNGRSPVVDLIKSLSMKDKAKVLGCLQNVEELGFDCQRVEFRQIRGKLWEIKIKMSSGEFRLFYITLKASIIIVLHGYVKKTQKAPAKEWRHSMSKLAKKKSYNVKYRYYQ
jgi:phage-related protein